MTNSILVIVYDDVQSFPPTLNQCLHMIKNGGQLSIVSRNVKNIEWDFPDNVNLTKTSNVKSPAILSSMLSFIHFARAVAQALNREPDRVIVYDQYSCLAYRLGTFLKKKSHQLWFHSHDVTTSQNKFSLNSIAVKSMNWVVDKSNGFSMPSIERFEHYKMDTDYKVKSVEIPNYPSREIFDRNRSKSLRPDSLKLVFSGAISKHRGIDHIIEVLGSRIENRIVELHLYTYDSEYNDYIKTLANHLKKEKYIHFHKPRAYKKLQKELLKYDIGVALYTSANVMDTTSPKGSNKLYEYGACGLPVLFWNNPRFREALANVGSWVRFIDLEQTSIYQELTTLCADYQNFSERALDEIKTNYNCEVVLNKVPFFNCN